jgi:glutathione S-transferase
MKLYDFPFSPNCRKVRAVAYELGVPFDRVHVDLLKGGSRVPEFLAKNPNGKVPVLEDGDLILWESVAILRYLATGTALLPAERRVAAEVDRWLAWQLAHLSPALSKVGFEKIVKKLTGRGAPDAARIAEGTAEFEQYSAVLDSVLAKRECVAGPLTIADFALAAHYSLAPACGLEVARYRSLDAWLQRVCGRASMARALAEAEVVP